jgi:hypothetical protein
MKTVFLSFVLATGLVLAQQTSPDEIASKRASLEKDKAVLASDKSELNKLQKQVDDLKKRIKLQEDNVKINEKRIQNLQKLNAMSSK